MTAILAWAETTGSRLVILGWLAYVGMGLWVGFLATQILCRKLPPRNDGSDDWAVGFVVLILGVVWPAAGLYLVLRAVGSTTRRQALDGGRSEAHDG